MKSFKTQIVEGRKVPVMLRISIASILLLSAYFLYINSYFRDSSMEVVFGIIYLLCMVGAFGINFLKPKIKGDLGLNPEGISFNYLGKEKKIDFSGIKNLSLNYRTYGGWWSHNFYGNENHLMFNTVEGEEYNFEIILKDKDHKETLKELLTSHNPIIKTRGLNFGRAAF